jgi:hypothetical protein
MRETTIDIRRLVEVAIANQSRGERFTGICARLCGCSAGAPEAEIAGTRDLSAAKDKNHELQPQELVVSSVP